MANCGCAQGTCSCRFEDSSDVEWSGSGIKSDPFLATPKPLIIADSTPTLALTLDIGDDVAALSAQPIVPVYVDAFTTDGTWTKPSGVNFARVMMIGGGGGGASGESHGHQQVDGGGGGDAGGVAIITYVGAAIPASAAVSIGQGGLGGVAAANSDGTAGGSGGDTMFGAALVRGGIGGEPLGLAGTHLALGNPPGQRAVNWDAEWNPAHYYLAPGAGGVGEGQEYSAQPGGYSHPGMGSRFPGNTGGGDLGEDGRDEPVTKMGGGGGGGPEGEDGGDGGLYGAGGGGGGSIPNSGFPGGSGGAGADGYLVVVSW